VRFHGRIRSSPEAVAVRPGSAGGDAAGIETTNRQADHRVRDDDGGGVRCSPITQPTMLPEVSRAVRFDATNVASRLPP
jgi:hypothetical protein